MKKILIIGSKGMAGHMLFEYFRDKDNYLVFGIARNTIPTENIFNLDVSNIGRLKEIIDENDFDAIINAIGILNKDAEDNPAKAIWFNSYFPHQLAMLTKNSKTKIIHISTDCVFSGKGNGGYTEDSLKDGIGYYAQSKALGEIDNNKDLTIRTSIIGPELNDNGIGLLHWFLKQSRTSQINGFTRAFWSGITTLELAKVIEDTLLNDVCGLKQISREKISKYNLLKLFNKVFRDNQVNIVENSDYQSDKSLVSNRMDYIYEVPTYEDMLIDLKNWMKVKNFYNYE
ncbi:dTDP-4-dehydrorhamnose reductase family protein [Sphingobacterium multivorum]|uniref:dTDP-4-dehydrorhamnose reductase family protein n=1 Tax=Sphingobacterium multivorum TaxID=28454 RepID=UPI0028A6067A|nr:SDR family oxidoreductase [Sphingobacterium multivorum]